MSGEYKKILAKLGGEPFFIGQNFALIQEDAVSALGNIPQGSVDMIFADPPYNLSNGGFSVHAGKRVSVDKGGWDKSRGFDVDYQFHLAWLGACKKALKPNGTLWVSGTYHSIYQCGYAMQHLGYHILNDIAWFKPNASPNLSCRYFTASHETLIWARKEKKAKHYFDYPTMKAWKDNWRVSRDVDADGNPIAHSAGVTWKKGVVVEPLHQADKQMRSVWAITTPKPSEKKFGKHPTQKPLALLERIVLASTKPGDVVLDPFTGSSTTGLAAAMHGRSFIGIDLEQKYLALSKKRFLSL